MAQKRMFSKIITNSDDFLELPDSSQVLYFHLNMNADDDGFIDNWKSIMRMTGTKEDDLKILIAKGYILPFDTGIIVIRHWRINNYIQKDRFTPTIHQDELKDLMLDNGVYELTNNGINNTLLINENLSTKEKRKIAYKNSDLPYSFEYKIKQAFAEQPCPICGYRMQDYVNGPHRPSIQHNIPLSKGGKHELGNISVICIKCNTSIKDKETGKLNSEEVTKKWLEISESENCIQGCIQECIHSIDKNSIDKNSIDNNIQTKKKFIAPTLEEIQQYIQEKKLKVDGKQFLDYFTEGGWKDSKGNQVKNWKQKLLTWNKYSQVQEIKSKVSYKDYSQRDYSNNDLEYLYATNKK